MNDIIARLRVAGFKPTEAVKIYESFMRFYDLKSLNEFVEDIEKNVETI